MSPVGGVGINLAVQDGVAAANILYRPLLDRAVTLADLRAVQRRRELPMRVIQRLQVVVQNRIIGPTLGARAKPTPPWVLRLFARLPFLRRIPARLIGLGFRPEHIRTPEAAKGAPTPAP
jgi:2-polyprenyl-6-methoxyphenol hydroxylase-like FAD-dependent oxidoreductase